MSKTEPASTSSARLWFLNTFPTAGNEESLEEGFECSSGAGNVQDELRTSFQPSENEGGGSEVCMFVVICKVWILGQQHEHIWKPGAKANLGASSQTL